jgi:hypothetical protein
MSMGSRMNALCLQSHDQKKLSVVVIAKTHSKRWRDSTILVEYYCNDFRGEPKGRKERAGDRSESDVLTRNFYRSNDCYSQYGRGENTFTERPGNGLAFCCSVANREDPIRKSKRREEDGRGGPRRLQVS